MKDSDNEKGYDSDQYSVQIHICKLISNHAAPQDSKNGAKIVIILNKIILNFAYMNPCIAIIDCNTLSRTALLEILRKMYGTVETRCYGSMKEFIRDSNRHFVHFFVSSEILFGQVDEFATLKRQTTVLSCGKSSRLEASGFRVLDISASTNEIITSLIDFQLLHTMESNVPSDSTERNHPERILSPREKDVLALMVKGLINKEIADTLDISITTVIFHRNNLCEKLGTRSIGKLTVHAILSGIIGINEI